MPCRGNFCPFSGCGEWLRLGGTKGIMRGGFKPVEVKRYSDH